MRQCHHRLMLLLAMVVLSLLAGAYPVFAAEGLSPEALKIANELNCPVCEGQSVRDSNSQLAGEMRQLIQQMLDAGQTPDQIKAYFVQRYGVGILRDPPKEGFVWTLWWGPVVGLVIGIAVLTLYFQSRKRPSAVQPADETDLTDVEAVAQRWLTSE
ncbi:cytochrome c-type biogenesis protein [Thermorudis peleae]|uniref:cytochrome c-type biogenesis protein n=1 Tax=Thermorudis peleae TaxID=1382356 RepID=UPI00068EE4F4|nr:cytochrome c-type biogenesis protein [Thermorudis peleae]